jgi:regulatory protein
MTDNELYKSSLNKAMALCAAREYCVSDISSKLATWGNDEKDIDRIIEKLVKENFINEERYATGYVKDKFNYNKWGKIKIMSQLRAKSIPGNIISMALNSLDNDLYKKTLSDLLSTHRRHIKAKNEYDLKGKLLRYGLSKGFESTLLYDLLNEMDEQNT